MVGEVEKGDFRTIDISNNHQSHPSVVMMTDTLDIPARSGEVVAANAEEMYTSGTPAGILKVIPSREYNHGVSTRCHHGLHPAFHTGVHTQPCYFSQFAHLYMTSISGLACPNLDVSKIVIIQVDARVTGTFQRGSIVLRTSPFNSYSASIIVELHGIARNNVPIRE